MRPLKSGRRVSSPPGASTPPVDGVPSYANFCPRCATPFGFEVLEGYRRPVCPQCGFVLYLDPKIAVICVIPLDGGILLGRRATPPGIGKWSFPAGYVNQGEVLQAAAEREVEEETSLQVAVQRLVNVYSEPDSPVVLVVYEAGVIAGRPQAGEELTEVGVFPAQALPQMAFEHDYRIVEDWLALRMAPVTRSGGSEADTHALNAHNSTD